MIAFNNTARPVILFSASIQGRFCLNICILVFGYTSKEHACLNGRIYGNNPRSMSKDCKHFFLVFIRDKVRINVLLRPLLWVLENSRYI